MNSADALAVRSRLGLEKFTSNNPNFALKSILFALFNGSDLKRLMAKKHSRVTVAVFKTVQ